MPYRPTFRLLIERANSHVDQLNNLAPSAALAYIAATIARADVAWVVYPETEAGHVVPRRMLVKDTTARGRRSRRRRRVRVECLPARDRFEAEAIIDAYGDGSTVITDYAPVPDHVRPHLDAATAKVAEELAELNRTVESANRNGDAVVAGRSTPEEIFAAAEIVHLVWQDPSKPAGIGRMLAKGRGRLMLAVQRGLAIEAVTAALRCRDAEQAAALWRLYGDGRASNNPDEVADQALLHALRGPRS